MVKTEHIVYNVEVATKRADELEWTIDEWADHAGVSSFTLRKWIYGDPKIKFSTVDSIVRPLGMKALDLIRTNGKKK